MLGSARRGHRELARRAQIVTEHWLQGHAKWPHAELRKKRTVRSRRVRSDVVSEALRLPFETRIVDGEYIAPRAFLRSTLFRVTKKGRRMHYEGERLATVGRMRITYTGATLDQLDYHVWIHMVAEDASPPIAARDVS